MAISAVLSCLLFFPFTIPGGSSAIPSPQCLGLVELRTVAEFFRGFFTARHLTYHDNSVKIIRELIQIQNRQGPIRYLGKMKRVRDRVFYAPIRDCARIQPCFIMPLLWDGMLSPFSCS